MTKSEDTDVLEDAADVEDVSEKVDDGEADEEEDDTDQAEGQVGDRVKDKEVEAAKPPPMIGVQLLKDSEGTSKTSRKSKKRASRISVEVW